jgi:DNA-binding MarR family transcriptional regulator
MKQLDVAVDAQDEALVEGIIHLGEALEHRVNLALEAHGLSWPKFAVLRVLVEAGTPLPLGVLGGRLHCVKSNVTQLVDRLEAEGLVQRVADPTDRRSKLAALTAEGRRRYEAGNQARVRAEREILSRLSATERDQLLKVVGDLVETPERL